MVKRKANKNKEADIAPSTSLTFASKKMSTKKAKAKAKKKYKVDTSGAQLDHELQKSNSFDHLKDFDDDDIIDISSASDDEHEDIVLDESDDSSSDEEEADTKESSEEPPTKKQKTQNDLTDNTDFISFGFSSEEEEETKNESDTNYSYDNYDSDNEYLSNDESGYYTRSSEHKAGHFNSQYPWIRNNDHSKQIEISDWLTMEIKDFVNYISPSADEIKSRNATVENLRKHITAIWPDSEVHCFGSFATDLYLPGSDIDMVVVSKQRNGKYDNKSSLFQLSSYLRTNKLAINIETIAKAKVPIIKFVDPSTKIHIDISFERTNGITAAGDIVSWIKSMPALRELVFVVKQFLAVRKLNVVHTGGLGGFAIICLVYTFLKLHPRIITGSINPLDNLGVLLIEFFELYGYNFGYDNVAIAFNENGPYYVEKYSNPDLTSRNVFSLAIQDPRDSSNNISRGTFNLRDIKRAFGGAFELLTNKCYQMNSATYKERLGQSVLGDIIKYTGKQRDFEDARNSVVNNEFVSHAKNRSNNGDLPPLPSEKSGRVLSEVDYFSDTTVSSSDAEEDKNLEQIFEKSQSQSSQKKDNTKEIDQLMGIESEDDEEEVTKTDNKNGVIEEDSDSDSDSDNGSHEKTKRSNSVDKAAKRQYWSQKSGETF